MSTDPWEDEIPKRYKPGEARKGKVPKLTNFGVFVELEPSLEGLLHISELADHKVESPESVVKVGDEIVVKVLRVDIGERKIGLSRERIGPSPDHVEDPEEPAAESPPPASLRASCAAAAAAGCLPCRSRASSTSRMEQGQESGIRCVE